MSPTEFESLIQVLNEGSKIEKVHLRLASLGSVSEDAFYALGEQLGRNKSLRSLTLERCNLHDYAVAKICWALKSNQEFPLEVLNLSHNALYNRIGHSLAEALEINTYLKELVLDDVKLGDDGITSIAPALAKNVTLLSLSHNNIRDQGAAKLGSMLALNTTLTTLNLSDNKIEVDGFNLLLFGLSQNTSLRTLNLAFNKLSEAQEEFSQLQKLSLQELNIGGNRLGTDALKSLTSALDANTSLTALSLRESGLNDDNFDNVIERLLPPERPLKSLDLSVNTLADRSAFTLSAYLDDTRQLTCLDLRHTKITETGIQDLIEALKKQKNVTSLLFLPNDTISHETSLALDTLLQSLARAAKAPTSSPIKQLILINQIPSVQLNNQGESDNV